MQIIPAIDLRRGKVVRLFQGKADQQSVYEVSPVATAVAFERAGVHHVHVIDLQRAFGEGDNLPVIADICRSTGLQVQVGGGIRSLEDVEILLQQGVARVILGTKALTDGDFLQAAVDRYAERIMVSIDVKDGAVAIKGWEETVTEGLSDIVERVCACGVQWLTFTQISRDGSLQGIDRTFAATVNDLTKQRSCRSILSGGVRDLQDIEWLCSVPFPALWGVVVGKALYEKTFDLAAALSYIKKAEGKLS